MNFLGWAELGRLPPEPTFDLGDLHPLAGAHPDQVRPEKSAIMASTLNSNRPIGSFGSCTEPPMWSFTSAVVSYSTMSRVSGSERSRVQFGDHEGVTGAAGSEGL